MSSAAPIDPVPAPTSALTISVPEAARRLGVSKFAVYDAVSRGDIIAVRIGRRVQIPTHVIDELLTHGNTGGGQDRETAR
jgi:excisionase family DNA binding protein